MKLNCYRYQCLTMYRTLKKYHEYSQELITFHVRQFDRTIQQYNKKRNIPRGSIDLSKRLAYDFLDIGKISRADLLQYLKKIGKCLQLDFYAYELFFAFLIFFAIRNLYVGENIDLILLFFRDLQAVDIEEWMPYACEDERELLTDSIYSQMSREDKQIYRDFIMKRAKKEGETPSEMTKNIIKTAKKEGKHVGFYIKTEQSPIRKWLYFIFLWGSTLLMWLQIYIISKNFWLSLLVILPSYMTSKIFANQFILSFFKPKKWLCLQAGSPAVLSTKTCIMLYATIDNNARKLIQKLEQIYCKNRNVNGVFCLLVDLPAANRKWLAGEKAYISDIQNKIKELNGKYGKRFNLQVRKREFCANEEQYCCAGGKTEAINECIKRKRGFDYLFVLDADIETPEGSILDLIRVACHPNNRRYGMLMPKVLYKYSLLRSKTNNLFNQFIYGQDIFDGVGLIRVEDYRKRRDDLLCGYVADILCISRARRNLASELNDEILRIKNAFHSVKQKGVTRIKRYMLMERCVDAVTPIGSLLIVILSTIFEREHFLLYGLSAAMPYLAPTYKRLIHQLITGHTVSNSSRENESPIKILLYSLDRSVWNILLLPYCALNALYAMQKHSSSQSKPTDIFSFFPFIFGSFFNMALGVYFLVKLQWHSIIFLVWSIVPAIIVMIFGRRNNKVVFGQRRICVND